LPRPTGAATHVIITEYDLPRVTIEPHDVYRDAKGMIWFSDFGESLVGQLDPSTGKEREFPLPLLKGRAPTGELGFQAGSDGAYWLAMMYQGGIARFDPVTHAVKEWPVPMDAATDFGGGAIGRIDAKTGALGDFETPTVYSRPRRGMMDDHDNVWFAEYAANKVGKFDTKTDGFDEWPVKVPWFEPYDVALDKHDELWTSSMFADRVVRLNPKTGSEIDYLLPRHTNVRNVIVDNSGPTVAFWAGNNHDASIIKLEPLP
jgi:virginiamycin B lyase